MDSKKYMLLINGQDKTDSVASFRFQDGMCDVVYSSAPKPYHYRAEKVQLLKVQSRIDPSQFIITVDGNPLSQVDEILDFGPFYRFLRTGKRALTYPKGQVELQKNCLTNQKHIISTLVKVIRENLYTERDERCLDEYLCYEKKPNGAFGAITGKHDDLLMTRAIGLHICFFEMDTPKIVPRVGRFTVKRRKKAVSAATI